MSGEILLKFIIKSTTDTILYASIFDSHLRQGAGFGQQLSKLNQSYYDYWGHSGGVS